MPSESVVVVGVKTGWFWGQWSPCQPAAGPSVGLRALLLLGLLVQLSEDEAVPALDEAAQPGLARLLVRVGQDQAQCRGLGDGAEGSQEVAGLRERARQDVDRLLAFGYGNTLL